jgi:small-conductance mechanosensitive channel
MGQLSRRQREKRAYTLTLVSGSAAVATVVFLVLWVIGVMGFGPVFLAALIAAGAAFLLRGTVRR